MDINSGEESSPIVHKWFQDQPQNFFRGSQALMQRWKNFVECNEDYTQIDTYICF